MKQNLHIKSIVKENKDLIQKLMNLHEQEIELKTSLLQIRSAKIYKYWLFYNKIKNMISLIPKICFALLYIILVSLFFFTTKIVDLILIPFKKTFFLTKQQTLIDGVSFIIPTWNKKEMVTKCVICLDKILAQEKTNIQKEIIVIDNGSVDKTYEQLSKLKTTTKLIIKKQNINLGFALGVKKGVEAASFNYIYLLNNDMEPQKDFFKDLIEYTQSLISKNKQFFGVASQVFFFDKTKRREESGKTYTEFTGGFINVAHIQDELLLSAPSITAYTGGGSSLINKHLFNFLGGYDYKVYAPMYCEDLDLSFNAWRIGYPSHFCPSSKVIHHHQSSSKKLPLPPLYYLQKNLLSFVLKNIHSPSLIIEHLSNYPLKIIKNPNAQRYALINLVNLKDIFISRLKASGRKYLNNDKKLLNFITFEIQNDNQSEK